MAKKTFSYSPLEGANQEDRIAKTFKDKIVLITGGTGFLGKVLVEKILRKCPGVGKIILLVRPKKGKNPEQRIEEMFHGPLFTQLVSRDSVKTLMSKITTVAGDTGVVDLGLSVADRAVCRTANIIVHSAACVRFDETLKRAVLLNVRSTKYMLEIAKECPNLKLFIHVSTAYCHPGEKVLEEKLYPPPADPEEIMKNVETLDDATLQVMEAKLLGEYPNTYAYTKALAEGLVCNAMKDLPLLILRPSVVIPIYKEPLPGWTDNVNGPIGLLIGAGKGVIRTMYGDDSGFADFIPADCVINVLMASTWNYLENGCRLQVMNLTTSDEVKVSWKQLLDLGRQVLITKIPLDNVAWYPGGGMTKYRWLYYIRSFLYHWLPALFVDTLLFVLGYKPLMLRIQKRISKGFDVFEYYTNNNWTFKSDSGQMLRKKLNTYEREAYKMDAEGVSLENYLENGLLAARRYILKEKDEDIPSAKRHMKMLRILDIILKISVYIVMFYFASRVFFLISE